MSTNSTCFSTSALPSSSFVSFSLTLTFLLLLYLFYFLLHFLYIHCLRRPTNLPKRYRAANNTSTKGPHRQQWAVVTGPTKGIGLAMAQKLYQRGFSILLVGRSMNRLHRVKEELEQLPCHTPTPGTSTRTVKVVEMDFGKIKPESIQALTRAINALDVALLVNNVGMVLEGGLSYFTERSLEEMATLCQVNMKSCVLLSRLVLPKLMARKSGGIINLSSMSGTHPSPLLATYAATKSFVHSLSMSLAEETSSLPYIDIQSVTPGFVSTQMATALFGSHAQHGGGRQVSQQSQQSQCGGRCRWCQCPPVVSAEECVVSVLRQLGNGQRQTSGHWKHALMQLLFSMVPVFILSDISHTCMLHFQQTRQREHGRGGGERKVEVGSPEEAEMGSGVGPKERNELLRH